MSSRQTHLLSRLVDLLTIPAGVFFFFTSSLGYPKSTAGIISGVLVLVGIALLPVVLRLKPTGAGTKERLHTNASWVVFIVFLIVMAGVVAYFMLQDE